MFTFYDERVRVPKLQTRPRTVAQVNHILLLRRATNKSREAFLLDLIPSWRTPRAYITVPDHARRGAKTQTSKIEIVFPDLVSAVSSGEIVLSK